MGKTQPGPSAVGWRLVLDWVGWWGAASWGGQVRMLGSSRTSAGVRIPWRAHTTFRSCCKVPELLPVSSLCHIKAKLGCWVLPRAAGSSL